VADTIASQIAGPTVRVLAQSVASSVAVVVPFSAVGQINWAEFLNTGIYDVMVAVGPNTTGLVAPTLPASGAATTNTVGQMQFPLPANMTAAKVVAVPGAVAGFSAQAIAFGPQQVALTGTQGSDVLITPIIAL
jgi:hypothetical protein